MKKMKDAILFYFSGTGNARMIATWFSKCALENNVSCRIFDMASKEDLCLNEIEADTLIVFISPVHGFNYPEIVLNFIRRFRKGKNPVVLMNTRAGMKICHLVTPGLTGIAFFVSSFILRRKGYRIVGEIPFDMPSNWLSLHPALHQKAVAFIFEKNAQRVKSHFKKLYSGKTDFASHRDVVQDVLISPVALAYDLIGRFVLAKSYYASDKCNKCNLCVRQCPLQAIKTIDNRPFWSLKCQSCMKCMNHCPTQAIETTHGLWFVAVVLTSAASTFLFRKYLPDASWIMSFLFFNFILFLLLLILYRVQHRLLSNKLVAQVIAWTSLTHYKWWGRYKANEDGGEKP